MPARRTRASCSSAMIGSSPPLPLVATTGKPSARSSRWCSGVLGSMRPKQRLPPRATSAATAPATSGATAAAARRRSSTIGAAGEHSAARSIADTSASAVAAARSATIMANGLRGRRLRARSAATAAALRASARSWNPPRPFSATIRPARSAAAASASARSSPARTAPSASHSASCGPQAGQQIDFGMEPARARIGVFRRAGGAQGEAGERGAGAVVGQRRDHAVARAAVHAGDERIEKAAVGAVVQLVQAGSTGGEVGHHHGGTESLRRARRDREAGRAARLHAGHRAAGDDRVRGRIDRQAIQEVGQGGRGALGFDQHAAAGVADRAGKPGLLCQAPDEGAEADALHRAGERDVQPLRIGAVRRHPLPRKRARAARVRHRAPLPDPPGRGSPAAGTAPADRPRQPIP